MAKGWRIVGVFIFLTVFAVALSAQQAEPVRDAVPRDRGREPHGHDPAGDRPHHEPARRRVTRDGVVDVEEIEVGPAHGLPSPIVKPKDAPAML